MAQHGYMSDNYGSGRNSDHDDERSERRHRDWRGEDGGGRGLGGWGTSSDRERWGDDDRGHGRFMFEDRGEGHSRWQRGGHDDDDDRGFFSRMGEQARSWFSDDDDDDRSRGHRGRAQGSDRDEWFGGRSSGHHRGQHHHGMSHYGREHGFGGFQGDYSGHGQQGGFGGRGDWQGSGQGGRQSFSSHPDDHYRSWRDKQMQALDREYQDYCREREQQFHQDFDSWRQNRQSRSAQQPSHGAETMGSMSGSEQSNAGGNDELLLERASAGSRTDAASEPMSATVGTDSAATLGEGSSGTGSR